MVKEKKFAYLRESSSKQVAECKNGIEAQLQDITHWLLRNDIAIETVDFVIDAGRSGTTADRPGFNRIRNVLKKKDTNVTLLIAQTDDRIMRNVAETINFMKLIQSHPETKIVILNGYMDHSSATNRYMTNNKAVANQFWSEKTSEDTINRMHAAAMQGRYALPGCPIGLSRIQNPKIITG